jgi:hypothetical protein
VVLEVVQLDGDTDVGLVEDEDLPAVMSSREATGR